MLPLVYFILFAATSTFSLKPMNSPNKEIFSAKERDKKSIYAGKSSKKSVSLSSVNDHKQRHIEHPLIVAVRNEDHDSIRFHLSNRYFNPNVQNVQLNTPLHEAAINQDFTTINLLFNDPRIDASIRNIDNKTARDLVDISSVRLFAKLENPHLHTLETLNNSTDIEHLKNLNGTEDLINLINKENQLLELRRMIFARVTLDIIANQECATIKTIYQQGLITAPLMNETIQKIKAKIRAIEKKQETPEGNEFDGNLPVSAQLPPYATDNFIMDMIFFRINLNTINGCWLK